MYFVDEEDDATLGVGNFLDYAFQTLLKLALVLGAGHERTHVERVQLLVFQVLGYVAAHYTLGQSLDDGRLTRTRLTYKYRVVLSPSREDLQHAAYLVVTSDDGVELALARLFHQILGILSKTLIVVVGRLRLHFLPLAQLVDGRAHLLLRASGILEDARGGRVDRKQSQQKRLNGDELVAHLGRNVGRALQHFVAFVAQIRLPALHAGQPADFALEHVLHLHGVHAELLEDEVGHVLGLRHDALQQVYRLDGLLAAALRGVDRLLDGLLRLDCKLVECHILFSFLYPDCVVCVIRKPSVQNACLCI